jgi:hypothetical protein
MRQELRNRRRMPTSGIAAQLSRKRHEFEVFTFATHQTAAPRPYVKATKAGVIRPVWGACREASTRSAERGLYIDDAIEFLGHGFSRYPNFGRRKSPSRVRCIGALARRHARPPDHRKGSKHQGDRAPPGAHHTRPVGRRSLLARTLHRSHSKTRVLILTGFRDEFSAAEALAAGVSSYVLKEQLTSDLFAAIETVCGGGTYVSPIIAAHLGTALLSRSDKIPLARLSPREREIFQRVVMGSSSKQISESLHQRQDGRYPSHQRQS